MLTNTYISSPGVVNTSPTDTTVYLLSSINAVGKELIIRDAAPLAGGTIIVSTTRGLYFTPSLSTVQLSSFTITNPYDYITVASRTAQEYMLLQSVELPTRTDNQTLTPNFLQISTLSTLATIATSNATLTDLTVNGRILADPAKTTALVFSTLTAADYLSTGQTTLSTATASYTALAAALQTPALNTLYSAYTANHSTLGNYTTLTTAAVTANLTQTGDLKPLGPITVTGAAAFNSTLRTEADAHFVGPAGFAADLLLVSSLTVPTTLSTVLSWTGDGTFVTSNYTASRNVSTITYNASQTAASQALYVGGSNVAPTGTATYVAGTTYVSNNWITPQTSTLAVSTSSATLSSVRFINETSALIPLDAVGTTLYVNDVAVGGGGLATFLSTSITSNWTSTGQFRTSTLQAGFQALPSYNLSSVQATLDIRGNVFISTALVMENFAIYGGTNPTAYATPAFNTIYNSTNGMLINNRLFIDHLQNRVGVNTSRPQYTLDVSGLIYQTSSIAYNVAGTSWTVLSDQSTKENIVHDISYNVYEEMIEDLKLRRFTYANEDTHTITYPVYQMDASGFPMYDASGQPIPIGETATETIVDGFAAKHGLTGRREYGFLAQDVEFYYPNSVVKMPFYKYDDFHFLNADQIMKAHYAVTRCMLDTTYYHSTLIQERHEFISTAYNYQTRILTDLSGSIGAPFNTIGNVAEYPNIRQWT
jgi:hypothetical protein